MPPTDAHAPTATFNTDSGVRLQITRDQLETANNALAATHQRDMDYWRRKMPHPALEMLLTRLEAFSVAIPSWALGTGGTRFGRFPGPGEPRNIFEKLEDIAVVHQLTAAAPRVSLHIPWDEPEDALELRGFASHLGLGFDAVNSNTFQDYDPGGLSYKFGSLCHTDRAVHEQAIAHNVHAIDIGRQLGSDALTIWLADGSNFPGQMHLRKSFERVLDGLRTIYAELPPAWQLFTEHKPYEPAFYATVVQDWGSSLLLCQELGARAACLVDLGHHLPNTNVELVVARLIHARKLGGFHFNDSMYGDDDLTTGSIHPYQLFLVFNELVDATTSGDYARQPAFMIDQSHNLKDPVEALLQSVDALQRAYAQALLVDREALTHYQTVNDVMMAERTLQAAFHLDVTPLVAEARRRNSGAIDPIASFRASGYRRNVVRRRPQVAYTPPGSL